MSAHTDTANLTALLDWQIELGADEAIGDAPVNRYEVPQAPPRNAPPAAPAAAPAPVAAANAVDPVEVAKRMAAGAGTLEELAAAQRDFPHCELRKGARNAVFHDGNSDARVMLIGEAPGREEDIKGKPFVGQAGALLDLMFSQIGLSRGADRPEVALYITNVLPWRPPGNRDPEQGEIAMMTPFLERHVELAAPELIVPMGNISCSACLGKRGITKLRGKWSEAFGLPALPMFHPAYLLRNPHAKRHAWEDLLSLRDKLNG